MPQKLAVEIEGGVHRIKDRYRRDLDKYNALTREGWVLLRYNGKMVHAGTAIDEVLEVIRGLPSA